MKRSVVLLIVLLTLSLVLTGCSRLGEQANADGSEEVDTSGPEVIGVEPEPTINIPQPTATVTVDIVGVDGVSTASAVEMYMFIEGVEGESTGKDHAGWIDILSYNYEVSGPVPIDSLHSSPPTMGEFSLTKEQDQSTPMLMLYTCEGTVIPEVVFELCRGESEGEPFLRYTLQDVIITKTFDKATPHLATYGSGSSLYEVGPIEEVSFTRLTEDISLNYSKIEWEYIVQGTGGNGQTISTGWSRASNTAL